MGSRLPVTLPQNWFLLIKVLIVFLFCKLRKVPICILCLDGFGHFVSIISCEMSVPVWWLNCFAMELLPWWKTNDVTTMVNCMCVSPSQCLQYKYFPLLFIGYLFFVFFMLHFTCMAWIVLSWASTSCHYFSSWSRGE